MKSFDEKARELWLKLDHEPIEFAYAIRDLVLSESEPVAWRWDQATYVESDVRGRGWQHNVFGVHKPFSDHMTRNVAPLFTAPQDLAALDGSEPVGTFKRGDGDNEWYESSDSDAIPLFTAPQYLSAQLEQATISGQKAAAAWAATEEELQRERKAREVALDQINILCRERDSALGNLKIAEARCKAIEAETTEKCAKVCDDIAEELQPYAERNYNAEDTVARGCAESIRALKEKQS